MKFYIISSLFCQGFLSPAPPPVFRFLRPDFIITAPVFITFLSSHPFLSSSQLASKKETNTVQEICSLVFKGFRGYHGSGQGGECSFFATPVAKMNQKGGRERSPARGGAGDPPLNPLLGGEWSGPSRACKSRDRSPVRAPSRSPRRPPSGRRSSS